MALNKNTLAHVVEVEADNAPFFTVEKVELGFFDNFANLTRDVRIGLSNGQFIVLLDVGDTGDWVADDVDPENNQPHLDDFIRAASCPIDCTVECNDDYDLKA